MAITGPVARRASGNTAARQLAVDDDAPDGAAQPHGASQGGGEYCDPQGGTPLRVLSAQRRCDVGSKRGVVADEGEVRLQ